MLYTSNTPTQNNFQYKKQGPSPISLVRATRIFSKAKTMKKKLICHWTFEKKEKEVFFRLTTFFFQEQKNFFQGTTFVQFFMYCKAKKNFGVIRKFLKKNIFYNLLNIF